MKHPLVVNITSFKTSRGPYMTIIWRWSGAERISCQHGSGSVGVEVVSRHDCMYPLDRGRMSGGFL